MPTLTPIQCHHLYPPSYHWNPPTTICVHQTNIVTHQAQYQPSQPRTENKQL